MKIQLLYFPGCPHVGIARGNLRRVLAARQMNTAIEEIDTTAPGTSQHLRNWGSPTILIDGVDVTGGRAPTGPSCRLYPGATRPAGAPSAEVIRAAIDRATR